MQNPLLEKPTASHGAYPFDKILPEHFLPALKAAIETAKIKLESFKKDPRTDFQHVICEKNDLTEQVDYIAGIFFNLHSAECKEELEKISPEITEHLTRFGNDISLDPQIFAKVKSCYEARMDLKLSKEEMTIIEKTYKSFIRNGALLADSEKDSMRELDEKLAKLTLTFSQNVLKATNDYLMELTDKSDLEGLPDGVIEAAAELAEKKGKTGSWCFSLDVPSMLPFMTYSKKRELRKKLLTASSSKTFKTQYDNQQPLKDILSLRLERAKLLGFNTHADYVLEERMAMSPKKVMDFLEELLAKAKPHAEKDIQRLKNLAKELDGITDLQSYDTAYYSEILKKRELDMDDEMLRPYFKLENVVDGIFKVANLLYNLNFKEVFDVPKYHEDVRTFEVYDEDSKSFVGLFYTDFFPRATKRGGAWMSGIREQGMYNGKVDNATAAAEGDAQIQALTSLRETHKARAKTATFQAGVYTGVTACYAAMAATGAQMDIKFIAKAGGAAALMGLYWKKVSKHKNAVKKVEAVMASMENAGKNCNPWTKSPCFCKEVTSKTVYPMEYEDVCVLNKGNFDTPKIALGCGAVAGGKISYDKECKCKQTNSCLKSGLKAYNPKFGLGNNLMNEANKTFDMLNSGEFDEGRLNEARLNASAMASKMKLKTNQKMPKPNLTDEQKKIADALKPYMAEGLANMAAASNSSYKGGIADSAGSASVSKLPDSVKEKLADAINVGYQRGGGFDAVAEEPAFEMPTMPGQGGPQTPGTEIVSFAEAAVSKADVSNTPETPIFDIISNRYRRSGWQKLDRIEKE